MTVIAGPVHQSRLRIQGAQQVALRRSFLDQFDSDAATRRIVGRIDPLLGAHAYVAGAMAGKKPVPVAALAESFDLARIACAVHLRRVRAETSPGHTVRDNPNSSPVLVGDLVLARAMIIARGHGADDVRALASVIESSCIQSIAAAAAPNDADDPPRPEVFHRAAVNLALQYRGAPAPTPDTFSRIHSTATALLAEVPPETWSL